MNTDMQSIVDFILREEAIKEELYVKQTILETKGDPIDDQWLNDEKHVETKVFTVSTDAAASSSQTSSSPNTSSSPHDIAAINMALQNAHGRITVLHGSVI